MELSASSPIPTPAHVSAAAAVDALGVCSYFHEQILAITKRISAQTKNATQTMVLIIAVDTSLQGEVIPQILGVIVSEVNKIDVEMH
jgi:hypothetical protein